MAISKLNPIEGGIPKGNTDNRSVEFPSPAVGDVYYNGELEILEIYNGTQWVAASAPPAVPSIISVTDVGTGLAYATGGTFTVTVAAGSGGSTPLQYNVVTSAGGFSASSNSTTLSLTGLTSNTSFVVSANAQNNFGTTVNSSPFSSILATTVPQAPIIGTATASTSINETTVTWTLGNNGGKAISAITIIPYLNGTTPETSRTAATTSSVSYTFAEGQLTSGSSYTFKVKCTNANGDSLESLPTNSIIAPSFFDLDFLVVAGGGGGANDYYSAGRAAGGGGAGGLRSSITNTGGGGSLENLLKVKKSTNYSVVIGSGGAGMAVSGEVQASNGQDSTFSTIVSAGGGGGGGHNTSTNYAGLSGGSGGGGANSAIGGSGTQYQGFGGSLYTTGTGSGGGGGAGSSGSTINGNVASNGGSGVSVSITGSAVTYAGGGGGGGSSSWINGFGNGGAGGGGNGAINSTGANGTANLGGGGGGGRNTGGTGGGSGGSGVVILRWLTSKASISIGAGLTADSTGTDGSYSYKRITAGSGNVSFV